MRQSPGPWCRHDKTPDQSEPSFLVIAMSSPARVGKAVGGLVVGVGSLVGLARVREELDTTPVVSVIHLHGPVVTNSRANNANPIINLENTRKRINEAFEPKRLEFVVLSIDSNGGSCPQAQLVCSYIQGKAEKAGVPLVAFIEDMGTSGGYYLACTAQEIHAAPSSTVGSIGVVGATVRMRVEMMNPEYMEEQAGKNMEGQVEGTGHQQSASQEVPEPEEVERVIVAGRNKIEPDIHQEQINVNNVHAQFIRYVKHSRGERLVADDITLFNGGVWTGEIAASLGLVDGLMTVDSWLEERYRGNVRVVVPKHSMGVNKGPYLNINMGLVR